ncbi:isochorismatase family protein [Pseudomonas sp. BBP2017]|uniref:isochorismatase family protein n=1 Tax=Pseudomonas sp. BBP2017 TaxID=2109731 RepID=UPI000D12BF55|nr:isochorismatase family protein [Pseudomonas sp. BBP2017]PSS58358.1 nicotinamidase [Pseudomonas sp. BBP2017]
MNFPKSDIASFDVDAQCGFSPLCPDELPVPGGDEIVPALNFMASLAGFRVGSKDAHSPNAKWVVGSHAEMGAPTGLAHADTTWVPHCVVGTPGFELLPGLPKVTEYGYMIYKGLELDLHPYGAVYHDDAMTTGVIEVLRSRGIKKVLVGGLALEYCVKMTVLQLLTAVFEVALYLPACRAISQMDAEQALLAMKNAGAVLVNSEEELTRFVGEGK